jgi:hypothetical protein
MDGEGGDRSCEDGARGSSCCWIEEERATFSEKAFGWVRTSTGYETKMDKQDVRGDCSLGGPPGGRVLSAQSLDLRKNRKRSGDEHIDSSKSGHAGLKGKETYSASALRVRSLPFHGLPQHLFGHARPPLPVVDLHPSRGVPLPQLSERV